MNWVLRGQSPMGGDGAAWRQVSHLLTGCWELHQSNAVLPEMGAGSSCLAGAEIGGGKAWNVS